MRTIMMLSMLLLCSCKVGTEIREISVSLEVPDPAWGISIFNIYEIEKELWVISKVNRDPDVMAGQVITTIHASIEVECPDYPVRHFVIGKTWNWDSSEPYTFIQNLEGISPKLQDGILVFPLGKAQN